VGGGGSEGEKKEVKGTSSSISKSKGEAGETLSIYPEKWAVSLNKKGGGDPRRVKKGFFSKKREGKGTYDRTSFRTP